MKINLPELSLVLLMGPSGSGKSTFAQRFFKPTEILSSDRFRGLVSDDESDQSATDDAFDLLISLVHKRLARGLLCVIDATNLDAKSRMEWRTLARAYHVPSVVISLHMSLEMCQEHNRARPGRTVPEEVVEEQYEAFQKALSQLAGEHHSAHFDLIGQNDIQSADIVRQKHWSNLKHRHGPFDIIGDIHGCDQELVALLEKLGYQVTPEDEVIPPPGRTAIFLGDLVDRGPGVARVLRLVMNMVNSGHALCVRGNHEAKLSRKLSGAEVIMAHGLTATWEQLALESEEFRERCRRFLEGLVSHYVLDEGRLVVVHAGLKERMHGRSSKSIEGFALYGATTGELDEHGYPVRKNWAESYRGRAYVVHGHTPVTEAVWYHRTANLDTGCVYGGKLSALRYPELSFESVPAARVYYERTSALPSPPVSLQVNEITQ